MGLIEDVEILKNAAINGAVKEKKFKYPFGKRVGKGQKKKNYVTVIILYENGSIDFKKYQITDQTIVHDLIPRLATTGHVMHDRKGNPVIILPNWSLEPFSPLEHYEKSMINGSNTKGFKILGAMMLSEKVQDKKGIATWVKWVIGLIIVGGIIFALVSGGGGTPKA